MSSDETRRVLELLAQGKITVEEARELLSALGAADRPPSDAEAQKAGDERRPRYLRINVEKRVAAEAIGGHARHAYAWPGIGRSGPKEVNIRIPLSLVRNGMRLGALVPGGADFIAQALRDRGIDADLSKIDPDRLEAILKDMGEITVDVDHGRAQVRISAE